MTTTKRSRQSRRPVGTAADTGVSQVERGTWPVTSAKETGKLVTWKPEAPMSGGRLSARRQPLMLPPPAPGGASRLPARQRPRLEAGGPTGPGGAARSGTGSRAGETEPCGPVATDSLEAF